MQEISGAAGGSWQIIDEVFDSIVVDGFDEFKRILIRDPWNGTRYKMEKEEFLNYWNTRGIYLEIDL